MALIETSSPLGMRAPDFDLLATDGGRYARDDFEESKVLVVMFICNHCPYVKAVNQRLIDLADSYDTEVAFVAICSNDAERYPDDGFDRMKEVAEQLGFPFPYLWDETQRIAEDYGAVCTPDFFVFDDDRELAYRGRLDDSWKDANAVTQQDLRLAIDALLRGERPSDQQHASMGCSIKWKY